LLQSQICACAAQVYMTMQLLAGLRQGDAAMEAAQALRPWRTEDRGLLSTVERTVQVTPADLPSHLILPSNAMTNWCPQAPPFVAFQPMHS
jgi:hypothetical protein